MSASVGNSIVKKNPNENFNDMLTFSQVFAIILTTCTIMLGCLYQPFIRMWVGEKLLLSNSDMILFCLYFYAINLNNIRNQYISGSGMWDRLKASYIIEAVGNLFLNIILGKFLGITGIILATIITIFFFNYIQRNRVLFKYYFKNEDASLFYKIQIYYFVMTVFGFSISYFICNFVNLTGILELIIRAIISLIISVMLIFASMKLTSNFDRAKQMLGRLKLRKY